MSTQRGNALFLILIAVALFAALSYAITQSGRGGSSADKETATIAAGQVTQYAAGLRTAVTRMVLGGTPASGASGISLVTTTTGSTAEVFDAAGGGMSNTAPPVNSGATAWTYVDATDANNGFYVKDVATNTSVTGREVIAVLPTVSLAVCQAINKGLGQASPYTPAYVTTVMNWAATKATYDTTKDNTLNGNVGSTPANINGQSFSCFSNATSATSPYHYYHVMIEQ